MKAERFATIVNGRIALLCEGTPPQELMDNQIELTRDELALLKALPQHTNGGDLVEGIELLQSVQDKIYCTIKVLVK